MSSTKTAGRYSFDGRDLIGRKIGSSTGADGREYSFRSVDKDPSAVLDSILRETVVADLVQDGISAAHPFGALVADPALGEFREEFAGMLGLIEERPDENEGGFLRRRAGVRQGGRRSIRALGAVSRSVDLARASRRR